jgi:putative ABC transport system permease protein
MLWFWLKDAYAVYRFYPVRTLLSLTGILLGIAAVCTLISIKSTVSHNSDEFLKKYGDSQFVMTLLPTSSHEKQFAKKFLTAEMAPALADEFEPDFRLIPYQLLSGHCGYQLQNLDAIVVATVPGIFNVMSWALSQGRYLHPLDEHDKVIVIGHSVAQTLNEFGMKTILGETISVDGFYFQIIGILEQVEVNPILEFDANQSIFMSIPNSTRLSSKDLFDTFIVQSEQQLSDAEQNLKELINKRFNVARILFVDAKMYQEALLKQARLTLDILAMVAGITLFLGVLSILNLLIILVNERKQEVGLRIAIGATSVEVGLQFLRETLLLCLLAGLFGMVVGELGAYILVKKLQMTYYFEWQSWLIGFPISIGLGLIVGTMPAIMAVRSNPVNLLQG